MTQLQSIDFILSFYKNLLYSRVNVALLELYRKPTICKHSNSLRNQASAAAGYEDVNVAKSP